MPPKAPQPSRLSARASGPTAHPPPGRQRPRSPPASKSHRTCSITGAHGCYASFINGTYESTSDKSNGHPVYTRQQVSTNSGLFVEMCIEFAGGNWEVKNALCRGSRRCFARISQDGPLESVAFLDTWMVSTGEAAKPCAFAPQPELCLRFSGDKRPQPKSTVDQSPAVAASAAPEQSPAAPMSEADVHDCAFASDGEGADEEPFLNVLSAFFDYFECGSNGQMDANLIAPTLQALDLEDQVHVICGVIQE